MKVAVVSTGSPDFQIDIVADGLVRLLGKENVHLDYNRRVAPDSRYSQLMMGFQYPNAFELDAADFLVVSTRTPLSVAKKWKERTGKGKVAVLDGEDDPNLRHNVREATVYFKREYLKGTSYPSNVIPLPFAAIPEDIPANSHRDIPVFWCGLVRNGIRLDITKALREMGIKIEEGRHDNAMAVGGITGKAGYNERLARSLVGISARGAGWDTYRYWEVPYFGAVLMSHRLGIVIPEDFIDGKEAVFFNDAKDMKEKLGGLLKDESRIKAIAEAGARAVQERHLSIHRAKKVIEALA